MKYDLFTDHTFGYIATSDTIQQQLELFDGVIEDESKIKLRDFEIADPFALVEKMNEDATKLGNFSTREQIEHLQQKLHSLVSLVPSICQHFRRQWFGGMRLRCCVCHFPFFFDFFSLIFFINSNDSGVNVVMVVCVVCGKGLI